MKRLFFILSGALFLFGCGDDVSSEEDAERAYVGMDKSVDKAIQLGFDGFNSASSANISPQTGKGDNAGTLTVNGMVDQGASDNKTMSLTMQMTGYTDDGLVIYDTTMPLPVIDLKLSNVPDGTVDGMINGSFTMSGELEGPITLTLTIAGQLQPKAGDMTKIERKPGTTVIKGIASSDYGDYDVNVTR